MKRFLTAVLVAFSLVVAPAGASAATSSVASGPIAPSEVKGMPVVPSYVDVQLWPEDVMGGMTLVVQAAVPSSATLPASVAIPLPKGATVTWAGEIFDTVDRDVERQPQLAADKSSLTITTAKSRVVQYEAQCDPYVERDGRRVARLDWVQSTPAVQTRIAFRLPSTVSDVKSTPAFSDRPAPDPGGSGNLLYSIPARSMKTGEKLTVSVDYAPRSSATPKPEARRPDYLLIALGAAIVVAMAGLAVVVMRSRQRASM